MRTRYEKKLIDQVASARGLVEQRDRELVAMKMVAIELQAKLRMRCQAEGCRYHSAESDRCLFCGRERKLVTLATSQISAAGVTLA